MYDIFEEMKKLQREMDRMFWPRHELYLPMKKGKELMRQPLSDIYQTDKEVIAKIEMPGIDKKDIQLHLEKDRIEIKAEAKKEVEEKKTGFYKQERCYTGYYRVLPLPAEVDADNAKASMTDGVLEVRMQKLKKLAAGKKLQIE